MPKPCIICFRLTNGTDLNSAEPSASSTKNEALLSGKSPDQKAFLSRFFKILERYLDGSPSGRKAAEKSKQFDFDFEGSIHAGLITCTDCSKLVKSFCDLHHQMKSTELLLNWKLWTLKNIMLCGQRVPSRMKDFREYADQLKIEDIGTDDILEYKRDLVAKCRRKLLTSLPKVIIKKYTPSDNEALKLPTALFLQNVEVNDAPDLFPTFEVDGIDLHDPEDDADRLEAEVNGSNAAAANSSKEETNSRKLELEVEENPSPPFARLRHHYRCETCWKTLSTQERMAKNNNQTHLELEDSKANPVIVNEDPEEEFNRRSTGAEVEQAMEGSMLQHQNVQQLTMEGQFNIEEQCNQELETPMPHLSPIKSTSDGKDKDKRCKWSVNSQTGNYKCSHCSKEFRFQTSVYHHHKISHLNLKYECPKCRKRFTQKGSLKPHLRKVHFEWWSKVENKEEALSSAKQQSNLSDSPTTPHELNARHRKTGSVEPNTPPDNVISPEKLVHHPGKPWSSVDPLTGFQKRSTWNGINGFDVDSTPVVQSVQHYSFVKYEATTSQSKILEEINSIPNFPVEATPSLGARSEPEHYILPDQMPIMQPEPPASGSGLHRPIPRLVSRQRANLYKYRCKICKKGCQTKKGMTHHMIIVHSWMSPNAKHKCEFCEKQFKQLRSCIIHQQTVHKGKRFPCAQCSKSFSHPSSRIRHLKECSKTGTIFILP